MASSEPRIAAAYIRVSTEDQTEFSPAAQLRELQEYAVSHSLILDERYVYSDEGISGRKAEKRPGFMQMISDAKSPSHPFDVILVHKYDRFARSREDSIVYKSMLKRSGVEVVSIKEPLSDGSYSGVMEAIYESFAEAYSINLGQEVRKGMTEKALRGEPQTNPPFGYRMKNKQFYPHETEAPIVRQIFDRFVGGEGYYIIAKWLNSQGITTHRGNPFENRTVEYMLRNPVYIGMLRWNPKRRMRRDYGDPDAIIVRGQHEPIIKKEVWDAAQSRLDEIKLLWRPHGRPNFDRKHWLCGIVRCAACNTTLVFTKPHHMTCNNYVRARCTHTQRIAIESLATAVISRLRDDLSSSDDLQFRIIQSSNGADNTQQTLRQALNRSKKKLDRLMDAYLNAAISLDDFKRLRAPLDEEISSAQTALSESESVPPSVNTTVALKEAIQSTIQTLESDASIPQKYDALNSIIERCTFDRDASLLTITYRITL
ncbi:MAG: recombinase family protein [Faecousia sp.]